MLGNPLSWVIVDGLLIDYDKNTIFGGRGGGGSGAIHKNRNVEIVTMGIPLFLEVLLLQSGHKLRQKSAK